MGAPCVVPGACIGVTVQPPPSKGVPGSYVWFPQLPLAHPPPVGPPIGAPNGPGCPQFPEAHPPQVLHPPPKSPQLPQSLTQLLQGSHHWAMRWRWHPQHPLAMEIRHIPAISTNIRFMRSFLQELEA